MALIKVKAAKPGEVALWELHKDHPGGEVYVASDTPVEVAETPEVMRRLGAGILIKLEDESKAESKPKKASETTGNKAATDK